jgi:hypothetical protein
MINGVEIYLVAHAITTLGALAGFFIRNEHRITKLETSLSALKDQHDALTGIGTIPHRKQHDA